MARGIRDLWVSGLLRADKIISNKKLDLSGLDLIEESSKGLFFYSDVREVGITQDGHGGVLKRISELDDDVTLLFHPFRYYVVYHIDRTFSYKTSATDFIRDANSFVKIAEFRKNSLTSWTSQTSFQNSLEKWNTTAETAIALDPAYYADV